jgi:hypothetical protein
MDGVLAALQKFVTGTGLLAQIIQYAILVLIVYFVLLAGSSIITMVETYSDATTMILPLLYDSPKVIYQDPNQQGAITINPSVNAPGGLEFSYSCFLFIKGTTFQGTSNGLRHIFHKGSPVYKPLMCPGVFVRNNDNTLVVYMNNASAWNTNCEIPNLPINKWFHLAIVVRNMNTDIYLNGNVAHRMQLPAVPMQNFGDLYTFKPEAFTDQGSAPSEDVFNVVGAANAYISRLQYSAYALNYEQIDKMMRDGPSTQLDSASQDLPPYLTDSWWVTYYGTK